MAAAPTVRPIEPISSKVSVLSIMATICLMCSAGVVLAMLKSILYIIWAIYLMSANPEMRKVILHGKS
jgi:hypothetical protein